MQKIYTYINLLGGILDQTQKLTFMNGHVVKCVERVFGVPDFKYYVLGDGLSNIFARFPGKPIYPIKTKDIQLIFGSG